MRDDVYDFGLRLKSLREEANLTQTVAADRLGVTVATIKRYENNTQLPPVDKLEVLARLYKTSLDYLRNIDSRKPIFIDDLPLGKQKTILGIIELIRNEPKE